jgi:S1-C subfamily serine protease
MLLIHQRGSKSGTTDTFALDSCPQLVLGRDASTTVQFDATQDDVVGRLHARISHDGPSTNTFSITDLGSRNGTYVNRQQVRGTAPLRPGDVVQLGTDGPEFVFDVDPRPAPEVPETRVSLRPGTPAEATRVSAKPSEGGLPHTGQITVGGGGIGRAAAEHAVRIGPRTSRTPRKAIGAGVAVLLGAVAFWALARTSSSPERNTGAVTLPVADAQADTGERPDSAAATSAVDIGATAGPSVVQIYFSWKLELDGQPVYHRYLQNAIRDKSGRVVRIVEGGPNFIPAYIDVGNGVYEPALTLNQGRGMPIGVAGSGSGFVVSNDGFILTNRHVGANWMAPYQFSRSAIGVEVNAQGTILLQRDGTPIIVQPPENWIPSESKQAGTKGIIGSFAGRHEYLKVGFEGNLNYVDAGPVTPSSRADVALLSVKVPRPLPSVRLHDNSATIRQGEPVTVLGYPSVSDVTYAVVKSRDTFNKESQAKVVPEVTLTTGTIAKITKVDDAEAPGGVNYYAPSGDRIQLNINTTGAGNSGGPLFDAQGRVIGIFSAGRQTDASISFAVPIKYGIELMNVGPSARR